MPTAKLAPSAAPARTRLLKPKPKPATEPLGLEDEPEAELGPDKRVVGGIVAGAVGLLVVAVAIGAFAFRKPPETAKNDPEPATPSVAAAGTPKNASPTGNSS